MIFNDVAQILADYKDIDVSVITMETSFGDVGLDSLDTVEIVMALEDKFGVEIEMDQSLKTVGDLVALLEAK